MIRLRRLLLLMLPLLLAACTSTPPYQSARLDGTIAYRARVALPPSKTRVEVRLLDVGREGAPSVILSEAILEQPKGFPLPFSLIYDKGALQQGGQYALDARLYLDGHLYMSTPKLVALAAQDAGKPVEILVEATGN